MSSTVLRQPPLDHVDRADDRAHHVVDDHRMGRQQRFEARALEAEHAHVAERHQCRMALGAVDESKLAGEVARRQCPASSDCRCRDGGRRRASAYHHVQMLVGAPWRQHVAVRQVVQVDELASLRTRRRSGRRRAWSTQRLNALVVS